MGGKTAGSLSCAVVRRMGERVFVTAGFVMERSKIIVGKPRSKASRELGSTEPFGSAEAVKKGLGGVMGPVEEGSEQSENVGDGVHGGGGEYMMLVSANVTCLPGMVVRVGWGLGW